MSDPLITVFVPTLNRPELLGRMIACFERQTYPRRELIALCDAGQYENQKGDRWEIISVPRRFRSLAEKNNAAIAMASFESTLIAKWDDDDCFMPWALEASVEALSRGEICQPRLAMDFWNGEWVRMETHNAGPVSVDSRFCYHSCWSYRRSFFEKIGGYQPGAQAGDDQLLDRKRRGMKIPSVGLAPKYPPFLWYNRPLPGRISTRGDSDAAYIETGKDVKYVGKLPPWTGEKVWERAIPAKRIARGW